MTSTKFSGLHKILCLACILAFSSVAFAGQYEQPCQQELQKDQKTRDDITTNRSNNETAVVIGAANQASKGSINQGAAASQTANTAVAGLDHDAATSLLNLSVKCVTKCQQALTNAQKALPKDPSAQADIDLINNKDMKACMEIAEDAKTNQLGALQAANAAQGDQNTKTASDSGSKGSSSSGGSGMGGMMGPLLGAAVGGLAGYMLGKQQADDKKDDATGGVVDANGNVNCTAAEAYRYSACNSTLASQCYSSLDTSACQSFASRYCTAGNTQSSSTTEEVDIQGEGVGTSFCTKYVATQFCESNSANSQCPSCMQLQANQATACQSNPALCQMQNSPDQIAQAKTSCPDDPMFSDPTYANGGGSTIPTSMANNLPNPVLPTGASSATTTNTSATNASGTTANLTGQAGDTASGDGSGAATTGSSGGSTFVSASVHGRALASSSGGDRVASGGSLTPASVNRGPASDVSGPYGPSLFSMGSQAIAERCQQGKLLHCSSL